MSLNSENKQKQKTTGRTIRRNKQLKDENYENEN